MLDICIVSLFGLHRGYGGVLTHAKWLMRYFAQNRVGYAYVSPYNYHKIIVYPVFALRYLLKRYFKTLSTVWFRVWHYYFLKKALARVLAVREFDILNAQSPLAALAALRLKAKNKYHYQVILTVHMIGSEADEEVLAGHIRKEGWYYKRIKRMEHYVMGKVDKIAFVSEYAKSITLGEYPGLTKNINIVIPNGSGAIPAEAEGASGIINAYSKKPYLVNIGVLAAVKNQLFLISVMEKLAVEFPALMLFIIGEGEYKARLEREISMRKLNGRIMITYAGSEEERDNFLKNSFLYVHSSLAENSPYSIIEAMSFGVPIVSLAAGGIKEMISHGYNGFLAEDATANTFARYVSELLRDKDKYEAMSEYCRQVFSENFDYRRMGARYLKFYQNTAVLKA